MIYFLIIVIGILFVAIFGLMINYSSCKFEFKSKIDLLEKLIFELNHNLEHQNQKIKLSEDIKIRLRESNLILSQNILDLNLNLFEDMYPKKVS